MVGSEYVGRQISSLYHSAVEVKDILGALGYKVEYAIEPKASIFNFALDLAEASVFETSHPLMAEGKIIAFSQLAEVVGLLCDSRYQKVQAYDQLAEIMNDPNLLSVNNNEAREQVVYILRKILVPKEIREDRHKQIRQDNMRHAYLASVESGAHERIAQLMSERGYFPPSIETVWADELRSSFCQPDERVDFENLDGSLNKGAIVSWLEERASEFDRLYQETNDGYYNDFGPEQRDIRENYYRSFTSRKAHTLPTFDLFDATRTRYRINDVQYPFDFAEIFNAEIKGKAEFMYERGEVRGYNRQKIVNYFMSNYGSAVVERNGEPIEITLYIDTVSVKNLLKSIEA